MLSESNILHDINGNDEYDSYCGLIEEGTVDENILTEEECDSLNQDNLDDLKLYFKNKTGGGFRGPEGWRED